MLALGGGGYCHQVEVILVFHPVCSTWMLYQTCYFSSILFIRCLNWVIFSFMKNKNTLLEEEWNLGEHAHIHQTATTLHLDLNMSSCAQCHQNNLEKSLCAGTNLQACDLQTLRQQSIKHRRDSVMEISPCTSRTRCLSRPV